MGERVCWSFSEMILLIWRLNLCINNNISFNNINIFLNTNRYKSKLLWKDHCFNIIFRGGGGFWPGRILTLPLCSPPPPPPCPPAHSCPASPSAWQSSPCAHCSPDRPAAPATDPPATRTAAPPGSCWTDTGSTRCSRSQWPSGPGCRSSSGPRRRRTMRTDPTWGKVAIEPRSELKNIFEVTGVAPF